MHQYGRFALGRWFEASKLAFLVEGSPCRSFCQILLKWYSLAKSAWLNIMIILEVRYAL
jgi:hypothetical protein